MRLNLVVVEVSDIERSVALYREGFGVELQAGNNGVDDYWIGGPHAEYSWREGSYLHFALYPARDGATTRGADRLHHRRHRRRPRPCCREWRRVGA